MIKVTVYQYGDTYKITYLKHSHSPIDALCYDGVKSVENIEKLSNNICRAKGRITELALCNAWEYFVTLTLDKNKQDRYNLDAYVKDLGVWIGNYNKKFGCNLKYILVPEQHKDGAWHMHGLFHDLAPASLERNSHGYFDMQYYTKRFGFISLAPIQDKIKISRYISKYVNKDVGTRSKDIRKHLFYSSRGLKGRNLSGEFYCDNIPADVAFQNDYVGIEWANSDEVLNTLTARLNILS